MRIAILTLPLHTNYGGILQAYALQTTLERMGHKVDIIHRKSIRKYPYWKKIMIYSKRILKKIFSDSNTIINAEKHIEAQNNIIQQHTQRFINEHINIKEIKSFYDIKESDYDGIVVGSDQIWRKQYFTRFWYAPIKEAFLDFTKGWDILRIAYAASFGKDDVLEYSKVDINECSKDIKKFNAVSVREKSGVTICEQIFGKHAVQMIDPTLLLNKDDYIKLIPEDNKKSSGNLMCYILDETIYKDEIIKIISTERGMTPFKVSAPVGDKSLPIESRIQPPVEEWLRGFRDADYVVTDSFHACVFSIIFRKPFTVIGNKDRGISRFNSLLETFNLKSRLLLDNSLFEYDVPENLYADTEEIIRVNQADALCFLNQYIN